MIVKDEETTKQALQILNSSGAVRYSDEYAYVVITTSETLEYQCSRAVARGGIAIVVPHDHESEMEDYNASLRAVKQERTVKAKKVSKKVKE